MRSSSVAGATTRALALTVREPTRTRTFGSFLKFFTQSADSPPPASMYIVPLRSENQIAILWGLPVRLPPVVRHASGSSASRSSVVIVDVEADRRRTHSSVT